MQRDPLALGGCAQDAGDCDGMPLVSFQVERGRQLCQDRGQEDLIELGRRHNDRAMGTDSRNKGLRQNVAHARIDLGAWE